VVNGIGKQAWVFLMKSDEERSRTSNRAYDDAAGIYYSYDSNVANSKRVTEGDVVVVREDGWVAGWGIIEAIEVTPNSTKEIKRCPKCRRTNLRRRRQQIPRNICDACGHVFSDEETVVTFASVTNFQAFYANTWTEAARPIDFRELAKIQKSLGTFNAIRPIDLALLAGFLERISGRDVDLEIELPVEEVKGILGGHTEAIVRRRRGQRAFRFQMLERYGERCAFSGVQPPQVLEAAHLYSYALRAEHLNDGGLLLRRDYHALFDAKLVTVNPTTLKIEIAPRLSEYPTYRQLDGIPLQVQAIQIPSLELLREHYDQAKRIFAHN
jgi:ribosomal protein L37AE/L43A